MICAILVMKSWSLDRRTRDGPEEPECFLLRQKEVLRSAVTSFHAALGIVQVGEDQRWPNRTAEANGASQV